MKKPRYDQLDSGLMVPDWMPGRRRGELHRNRQFMFTPGGGCAGADCHCSQSCTIFFDDFATDDLAANWTEQSGDWSIADGVLSTSSSNAILTCNTTYPGGGFHNHVIQVSLKASTGKRSRIIFSYVDSSNYNFIEVYWNGTSSYVYIKKNVAGTISTVATSQVQNFTNDAQFTFKVCVSSTAAVVNVVGETLVMTEVVSSTTTTFGTGTGSISAALYFDSVLFSKDVSETVGCPSCLLPCSQCDDGLVAAYYQVSLSGISTGLGLVAGDFNKTFILATVPKTPGICGTTWNYFPTSSDPESPYRCYGAGYGIPVPNTGTFHVEVIFMLGVTARWEVTIGLAWNTYLVCSCTSPNPIISTAFQSPSHTNCRDASPVDLAFGYDRSPLALSGSSATCSVVAL
ncbi:hypothetical protein M0R72_12515 [Candidatus Pacearchaeota archaeon]|jgi:hypothetical protein|nr:hypothetical protein [Candidatus Pacearchaeota archaeon]